MKITSKTHKMTTKTLKTSTKTHKTTTKRCKTTTKTHKTIKKRGGLFHVCAQGPIAS